MSRSSNWDTWKGFAIISVVAIHVTNSTREFPADSFNFQLGLGLRQALNYCVALFFALSGYFSPDLTTAPRAKIKQYLSSRLTRIIAPYVAWTLIFLILKSPDKFTTPSSFVKAFVLGQGIGIGYFVVVLCCLIVVHPLTCRFRGRLTGWLVAWAPVAVTMGAEYYLRIVHPAREFSQYPFTALPFTLWFGFFHSGFLLKPEFRTSAPARFLSGGTAALLILAGLGLSFMESHWLQNAGLSFADSQIKISSFLYSFAIILAVLRSPLGRISLAPAAWLGTHSYPIYLSHLLILSGVQAVLERYSVIWANQALYVPLATLCTISFFVIVHLLLVPRPAAASAGSR